MGRLPAVVIVARHGSRLDAADSQWHLNSATPYDSPLTYGGWLQARALGARVASLLEHRHARPGNAVSNERANTTTLASASDVGSGGPTGSQMPRLPKYRIVMHTSPFTRCVQTSIGIAAGMGQYQGIKQQQSSGHPGKTSQNAHFKSNLESIKEPELDGDSTPQTTHQTMIGFLKVPLRVDAFLGEWLNPDYFESITPPPSSPMMVVGAKADLLRPGNYDQSMTVSSAKTPGRFPSGWDALPDSRRQNSSEDPLEAMAALNSALPKRERAASNATFNLSKDLSGDGQVPSKTARDSEGYVPLAPTYAISSSDPVPPGFISHARDACVDVDYQWDSMREPHNWGHGGDYGEEWGIMHKRCRNSLHEMLKWYEDNGRDTTNSLSSSPNASRARRTTSDDETETVLIIVSHGAICNAIIGALTDRAVLLDVGLASLTMAVRKDSDSRKSDTETVDGQSQSQPRRRSSMNSQIAESYELEYMASTEHLRAGANPLAAAQARVPRISSPYGLHNRHGLDTRSPERSFSTGDGAYRPSNSEPGSYRRSSYAGYPQQRRVPTMTSNEKSAGGLWHRPTAEESQEAEEEDDMILNFEESTSKDLNDETSEKRAESRGERFPSFGDASESGFSDVGGEPLDPPARPGLWGSVAATEAKDRDLSHLRRWTETDTIRKRAQ